MTLSDYTNRRKYYSSKLATTLLTKTVAHDIFSVDSSNNKLIINPYISTTTPVMGALAGTYTAGTGTTTDDTLTVNKEIINAQHIYDFESRLSQFDLAKSMLDQMTADNAVLLDKWALNRAMADGTGTYATAAGGITKTNAIQVLSDLTAQLAGYQESYAGNFYFVIENTELSAIQQAGAAAGFTFADKTIYSGQVMNLMGVDIYVVRTGTFVTETVGGDAFTNAAKRLFGVKNTVTLATPSSTREGANSVYEEKAVDGKTGKQLLTVMYTGLKVWTPKASLTVKVTLTP